MSQHQTKHTPTGDDLLVIFADGLDASGDGRGWSKEHQAARDTLVRAVNEREELIAALGMVNSKVLAAPEEDHGFGSEVTIRLSVKEAYARRAVLAKARE